MPTEPQITTFPFSSYSWPLLRRRFIFDKPKIRRDETHHGKLQENQMPLKQSKGSQFVNLFMQNEPNLQNTQITVNSCLIENYNDFRPCPHSQNKPKQTQFKPNQTQLNPILNPNTNRFYLPGRFGNPITNRFYLPDVVSATQIKPKTNPISNFLLGMSFEENYCL